MAAFLSEEFLREAGRVLGGLDPVETPDASIQYVVSGAPDGKVTVGVTVDGGRITVIDTGKLAEPDITVTLAYDEALALVCGDTTADVSYMRGATKVEGDHVAWLLGLRDLRTASSPVLAELLD